MLMMDMSLPGAHRGPWLACRGLRGHFLWVLRSQAHQELRIKVMVLSTAGVARLTRDGGLAGSLAAFLGPGKMCG